MKMSPACTILVQSGIPSESCWDAIGKFICSTLTFQVNDTRDLRRKFSPLHHCLAWGLWSSIVTSKSIRILLPNICSDFLTSSDVELYPKPDGAFYFIDIPGKITFQESKILSPGSEFTIIKTPLCTFGIGICYDLRFAEMAQWYRRKGCDVLVYPGAFNMTTGPAHWQILQQARAVDNQVSWTQRAVSSARLTSWHGLGVC